MAAKAIATSMTTIRYTAFDKNSRKLLLDAFRGIPRSLQLANINNLAEVIGVVGADVGDARRLGFQFLLVRGFDGLFPILHHLDQPLFRRDPGFAVEFIEGLIVVAAIGQQRGALEAM